MDSRNRALFLLFFDILVIQACVAARDICESCKHKNECPQFGEMSRDQQQQWMQKFHCESSGNVVGKGDIVCCPGAQIWGFKEQNPKILEGNNLGFQNDQLNHYNYGSPLCRPQSLPPTPESGCCGVDMSDGDMLTDLEEFLQFSKSRIKHEADFEELGVTLDDRIAGGQETDLDQYPWTAYLSIEFYDGVETKFFGCGGSLISSRFILTAAHCMVNGDDQLLSVNVTLAEYDKRTFPRDCVTGTDQKQVCIDNLEIAVEGVIVHPDFIEDFLINDVALLKLKDAAPYSRSIRPICLPSINIDSPQYSDLPLATAGWGLNVSVQSEIKQFTTIHVVPKTNCKAHYVRLTEGHICASGKRTEDTCKGDSGGPLMMLYKGKYYLVGIVSGKTAAYNCGTPVPSLYTNVFTYLDWIKYFVS